MYQWDKLIQKILSLSADIRFEEIKNILESYGYVMHSPKGGSSHYTFRKEGCNPITIPKHKPIKKIYVEMVKEVVINETKRQEDN